MRALLRTAAPVLILVAGCGVLPASSTAGVELDLRSFAPSAANPDPSTAIEGVEVQEYEGGLHVGPDQRVAYTRTPPTGGAHDRAWAACNGVVYPEPVRSETLVHSLEHGAVWIAYDPDRLGGAGVAALAGRVEGRPYTVMSPYPGLARAVALQSWGHQLLLDDPDDPRIDAFITALRANPNTHPEPGASCDEIGRGYFDRDSPPPFAPVPADGVPES
jgi:hypothetical protein